VIVNSHKKTHTGPCPAKPRCALPDYHESS